MIVGIYPPLPSSFGTPVNNGSDAEAISSSKTESIVDDYEVPLEEKLSDIEVFGEGNEQGCRNPGG